MAISAVSAKKADTADNFISYDVLYEKGHISLNEKRENTRKDRYTHIFVYRIHYTDKHELVK